VVALPIGSAAAGVREDLRQADDARREAEERVRKLEDTARSVTP
jgi:hypothetical protein